MATLSPAPEPSPAPPPRARRSLAGRAVSAVVTTALLATAGGALLLAAGFFWFVSAMPDHEVELRERADGIVVLTGGTSRIADALELLAAGLGRRLLISGVHRTTSMREIARLAPHREKLVACCVDLDYSAVNTLGNAAETRRWAKSQNFQSLIVVTSNYHMPRSMAELRRQLPEVRLTPFPVVSDKLRAEPWWSSLPTAKLLISEYLKYMVAQVRMRLEPAPDATDVAVARGGLGS
ncbi:MAG: YdcF family protein [Variibacter sp.]|nr:YdcF family protein [Variibacter sp.]